MKKLKGYIKFVVVFLVIFIAIGMYVYTQQDKVSTDDAAIDGQVVLLSPKVAGYITKLNVQDNQMVKAGDVIAEIDSTDYIIRRDKAQQSLVAAQAAVEASEHNIEQVKVTTSSAIDSVTAQINSAEAKWEKSAADRRRIEALFTEGVCSQQQLEETIAIEKSDRSSLEKLNADLQAANTAPFVVKEEKKKKDQLEGKAKEAEKELEKAEDDLAHTKIIAPIDGRITNRSIEVGNYVQIGQHMLSIVGKTLWINANFKETQLEHVQPGQKVDIQVDAFPNEKLHGKVDSVQAGTGSYFSLFPAENATGNFVKTVQRVPVKILFDEPANQKVFLGPGMSVIPTIYTERNVEK